MWAMTWNNARFAKKNWSSGPTLPSLRANPNRRMKNTSIRNLLPAIAAAAVLSPAIASGHPGHSVLDFTAGSPHAGHESEIGTLLIATALTVALFAGARWLAGRRR